MANPKGRNQYTGTLGGKGNAKGVTKATGKVSKSTAPKPPKMVHFGSSLHKGAQIKGGTIAKINGKDRKTGQRKATLTNGAIQFIEPSRRYKK